MALVSLQNQTQNLSYEQDLLQALHEQHPDLLGNDAWNGDFINAMFKTKGTKSGQIPIPFHGLPTLPKLELKLYWTRLLSDPRHWKGNHKYLGSVMRRRLAMQWLNDDWSTVAKKFKISHLAAIPHPTFSTTDYRVDIVVKHHPDFIALFSAWSQQQGYTLGPQQAKTSSRKNGTISKCYPNARLLIAGHVHKQIIINQEQLKPFESRYILLLNDLYDENDTRFKDRQRTSDAYLNFYRFPDWMRDTIKYHILEKIEHRELAPTTLVNYLTGLRRFSQFLYTHFEKPSPAVITDTLLEDNFISWGNAQGFAGRNWFTHTLAWLNTAARLYPERWPSLSVSNRAARKISRSHYTLGSGRLAHHEILDERMVPKATLKNLQAYIHHTPYPIAIIFALGLVTGARAEDLHAISYDCLKDDPEDNNFMSLSFWQNKVSKWNVKPLLKTDKHHAALIKLIKQQQAYLSEKHGKATHYLFPSFAGCKEVFTNSAWTRREINRVVDKYHITTPKGEAYHFAWHQLRHHKGTAMAHEGHDILSIMMELGHAAPDMAAVYVNNRLQLKKKALLDKGAGHFFTIEGKVDESVAELLVKKDQLLATRVTGGACALPAQIGQWCQHAHACFNCQYFRADSNDREYFVNEKNHLLDVIKAQNDEAKEQAHCGRIRMAAIIEARQVHNQATVGHLEHIVTAIEQHKPYSGTENKLHKIETED